MNTFSFWHFRLPHRSLFSSLPVIVPRRFGIFASPHCSLFSALCSLPSQSSFLVVLAFSPPPTALCSPFSALFPLSHRSSSFWLFRLPPLLSVLHSLLSPLPAIVPRRFGIFASPTALCSPFSALFPLSHRSSSFWHFRLPPPLSVLRSPFSPLPGIVPRCIGITSARKPFLSRPA